MKSSIENIYNISIDKLYYSNNIYFYYNYEKYYVIKCNDIKLLDIYNKIINNLNNNNIESCLIINNTKDKVYFEYKKEYYILVKGITCENMSIDVKDIIKYNIDFSDNNIYIDEINNMKSIVDSIENTMSGYISEYQNIQNYFDYYVGLAENAISYLINSIYELGTGSFCLSHKNMYNNTQKELCDLINLSCNYKVYDIGRYINNKIYNDEEYVSELKYYLNNVKLDKIDYYILYSIIIFPYNFFNDVNNVINKKYKFEYNNDKVIRCEIEYKKVYSIICKYSFISKINWIND